MVVLVVCDCTGCVVAPVVLSCWLCCCTRCVVVLVVLGRTGCMVLLKYCLKMTDIAIHHPIPCVLALICNLYV